MIEREIDTEKKDSFRAVSFLKMLVFLYISQST